MPEAVMLAIDTSDYMRNGDYYPTRLLAAQDAANVIVGSKMQSNPENTIGFLCMGGSSCVMKETLTADVDRVMATMTRLPVGGSLHFTNALQIASLALSYRSNPRAEKRIVAFVGSPILDEEKTLEKLAKKLRKDDVAIDIVSFGGIDGNDAILTKFIDAVNKQDNSRLLTVPRGAAIVDMLYSSPILIGNEAAAQQQAAGGAEGGSGGNAMGGGGGGGGFEFGVDPNIDPELAMVLRMSAEEERRRLEAASGSSNNAATSSTAEVPDAAPASSSTAPISVQAVPTPIPFQPPTDRPMTEEEEIEFAIALSMQDQTPAAQPTSSTTAETEATSATTPPPPTAANPAFDPAFDAAMQDPDFLAQLEAELEGNNNNGGDEEKKKKDGDAEQE